MHVFTSINACLEIKYFKLWYLIDICKKLIIAMKTLGSSGVSNTPKYCGIQNIVFYMIAKHLIGKNTIVFFNTMVLSQNFKNTLFSNRTFYRVGHVIGGGGARDPVASSSSSLPVIVLLTVRPSSSS
jgi:hypothetical protein